MIFGVIVADDELDFSEWLRSLLDKNEDFEVLGQAYDGAEAINLIVSTKPDVVIADIYMPERNGLEVTRYVRRRLPDVKVILISAYEGLIHKN